MKYVCDWCKAEGVVIGNAKSFPGTRVFKCTKCHHEWEGSDGTMTAEEKEASKRFFQIVQDIAAGERDV